jgi:hypothetical protein
MQIHSLNQSLWTGPPHLTGIRLEVSQPVEDTSEDEVSEEDGVVEDSERKRFSPSVGTWIRTFPGMETFSERIE